MKLTINKKLVLTVFFSLLVVFLDQISKYLVISEIESFMEGIEIFYGFNLVYVENKGISFGFLSQFNVSFYLGILSFIVSVYIIYLIYKASKTIEYTSLSLILGGAIGNGIDRVVNGYVVDFLDFYYSPEYHWPAFNLADSFITIGAIIFFLFIFFEK
jgi:signal peptidase II